MKRKIKEKNVINLYSKYFYFYYHFLVGRMSCTHLTSGPPNTVPLTLELDLFEHHVRTGKNALGQATALL